MGTIANKKNRCIEEAKAIQERIYDDIDIAMKDKVRIKSSSFINDEKLVRMLPAEFADFLYSNENFIEYLKACIKVKRIDKNSRVLELKVILSMLLVTVFLFCILKFHFEILVFGFLAMYITLSLLELSIYFVDKYEEFYEESMTKILLKFLDNIEIRSHGVNDVLYDSVFNYLKGIHTYSTRDKKAITSPKMKGDLFEITLYNTFNDSYFNGIVIDINYENSVELLEDFSFTIYSDHAVRAKFENVENLARKSNDEFVFNTEELNEKLECYTINNQEELNDERLLIKLQQIITPTFEERLLFLSRRYKNFGLHIQKNKISIIIDLNNNLSVFGYHNKNNFSESAKKNGCDEFSYYNVVLYLEQLFLIKYLDGLYDNYICKTKSSNSNLADLIKYERECNDFVFVKKEVLMNVKKPLIEKLYNSNSE